jgi:hypothetical protein
MLTLLMMARVWLDAAQWITPGGVEAESRHVGVS